MNERMNKISTKNDVVDDLASKALRQIDKSSASGYLRYLALMNSARVNARDANIALSKLNYSIKNGKIISKE